MARIQSINVSPGGIPKVPLRRGEVVEAGVVGDGHDHEKHRTPLQAISLLDEELLDAVAEESGLDLRPGSLGENLTVRGVGVQRLGAGDRLGIGEDGPVLEITRVRPPCYVLDAWSPDFKRTLWNRIGMYARVIRPGSAEPGDPVHLDLRARTDRPLVRTPKEGCVDGVDFARDILRRHGLHPLSRITDDRSAGVSS
ncbi:MAG: MOSC domain-containing protein [Planctomycetota bacterium]|nr:MOSC domain-containing protein [Planctomycetota bacterium]